MQKLQPKLKEVREKYKDDPQRQQQESAKIMQEAKYNPISGCLPMLLQMPIFIALYQVLFELTDRVGQEDPISFYSMIPDLAASPATVFGSLGILATIPYLLLVALFGVSMLVPMLISKQTDSQSRIVMVVMTGVMLFVGWSAPAGVLLYWDASSLIAVGQQYTSRYFLKKKDEAKEAEIIDIAPVKVAVDRKEKKARPRKKGQ
jgi:YidC/Oxa1 family membrane protein insertase